MIEDISQGRASSHWRPFNATCEGPIAGWQEMSTEAKVEHLGEQLAMGQASRARNILRFVFLFMNICN